MCIADYTRREIEHLIDECNFTAMEESFFLLRSKGITIEECAERLNISTSCANVLSKKIKRKILRVNQ